MLTALYYPHVTMSSALVKNAFFLWDRVEFIVPRKDFEPDYKDAELRDAVKIIAVPRNKTLRTHPMSWLYSTKSFPVY